VTALVALEEGLAEWFKKLGVDLDS